MAYGGGFGARPPEFTKVGLETEVKIPWETYKKLLIAGPVSIWCLAWIPGWLIWLRVALEKMSAWRWLSREWWPWASGGGIIWPILMCFVWWGSAPTWVTIYRYLVETVYKRTPEYTPWNSENGPWSPLAHRRLFQEEEWEEEPIETVDVNLIERNANGKLQVRVLERIPTDQKALRFYAATVRGGAFTEEGAKAHKLSRGRFTAIRDMLMDRGLAEWNEEENHNDGVKILDSGLGLMESLSQRQHPPTLRSG